MITQIKYRPYFNESKNILIEYTNAALKKKFDLFNREYFHNKIKINKVLIASAPFHSSFVLGMYTTGDKDIYINKNRLPDQVIDLILLHEMIHAYTIQVENLDPSKEDPHGHKFEELRQSINKSLKYPIPRKEDMASIDAVLDDLGVD